MDKKQLIWMACGMISIVMFSPAFSAEIDCGPLVNDGLTWDYNDPKNWQPSADAPQSRIKLVENVHFKPYIEALIKGNTSGEDPFGDIEYTLRRFPNHHRALWAISRYFRSTKYKASAKRNVNRFGDWKRTPHCFFDRAIRFRPNDSKVRTIYAAHLHLSGASDQSLEQYRVAESLGADSPDFYYNYGLLLFDLKKYPESKQMAINARNQGHPLQGLINKLDNAGYWP